MSIDDLAARKALLIRQAELERMQLSLAWHDARAIVAPPQDPSRAARFRPIALYAIGFAAPLFGLGWLSRLARGLSIGLAVMRIVRVWRTPSRSHRNP